MTVVDQLSVMVGADISALTSGLNRGDSEVEGFASRVGGKLAGLGAGMTAVTAPLIGGLVVATNQAIEFNESVTNSAAVMGLTASESQNLQRELLAIGGTARSGPQEVANAFYDIVGGVADASTHMAILNAAIATSEAGNSDLAGTTSALISVMNSYGYEAEKAAFASDILTNIVGKGVGTMDEFASALPQVAGLAAANGVELENLGASMAFITTKGYSASEASTQLKAVMTSLLNPNEKMKNALKAMGVESGSAALAQWGLAGTMGRLQTALGGSTDAMAAALGSVEALNGAIILNQPAFEAFIDNFYATTDGATEAARAIQMKSAAAEIDLANAALSRLATTVGLNLLPPIGQFATVVAAVSNEISDFLMENPLIADVLMDMAAAAIIAGPALGAIGLAIMALASPFVAIPVLATAAVAGIAGLVSAYENFGSSFSSIQIGDTTIGAIAASIETAINDAINQVGISGDDLAVIPDQIASAISDAFSMDFGGFSEITTAIQAELQGAINDVTGGQIDLSGVQSFVEQNFESIVNLVINTAWIIFGGPVWAAIGIAQTIASAIENDFLGIRTFLEDTGIAATVESAFSGLKATIDGIIQSVFGVGEQTVVSPAAFDFTGMDPGGGSSAVSGLTQIANDIKFAIDTISQVAAGIGEDVIAGISDLGAGVGEFIEGLSGAETEGLYEVARVIVGVIGSLVMGAAQLAAFGVGAILSGIGAALGPFGEALGSFITAVSRIGEGDIGGAISAFAGGVLKLGEAVLSFPAGIADTVLEKIEAITGVELPSVSEGLGAWGPALQNAGLIIAFTLDDIKLRFQRFGLDVELEIIKFVAKWKDNLAAIGIDIAPNLQADSERIRMEIAKLEIGPQIASELQAQVATGSIDLSEELTFTVTDSTGLTTTLQGPLIDALRDPAVRDAMGLAGKQTIQEALLLAAASGDGGAYEMLVPIAAEMGIPIPPLVQQTQTAVDTATAGTFTANPNVNTNLVMDLADINNQIKSAITGQDYSAQIQAAVDVFVSASVTVGGQGPQMVAYDTADGGTPMGSQSTTPTTPTSPTEPTPPNGPERATGAQQTSGATNVYNIASYGQSVRELVELIDRERAGMGAG